MQPVDRVMRAYAGKHVLTPKQALFVREQLAKFFVELMSGDFQKPNLSSKIETGESQNSSQAAFGGIDSIDAHAGRDRISFKK